MPKNSKNEHMIRALIVEVIFLVIKFGWIANILKSNTIKSLK